MRSPPLTFIVLCALLLTLASSPSGRRPRTRATRRARLSNTRPIHRFHVNRRSRPLSTLAILRLTPRGLGREWLEVTGPRGVVQGRGQFARTDPLYRRLLAISEKELYEPLGIDYDKGCQDNSRRSGIFRRELAVGWHTRAPFCYAGRERDRPPPTE